MMDYKVLYRKYRPDTFDKIMGQDYTINILKNAIINKKLAHAYIFNGPRGTGKTSTAKILAKTINCENPINGEACGECNSCKNIKNNPDIIEIDAASNNGVDEIRELIENVKIAPSYSKYKVYIIDEVHMMTQSAFNALLLTLEEPPKHIIFILATTNIESVPITILSRCQKFDFKKIKNNAIIENIKIICEKEKIKITDEAIEEISYLSEGGMRDALSILDQLSSENTEINIELISNSFGSVPNIIVKDIINALDEENFELLKDSINKLKNSNLDYKIFLKKIIDLLSKKAYENNRILNIENIKNIIFDLIKIINNYNININPFILIELTLLDYINKSSVNELKNNRKDEKIISREIISENKKDLTIKSDEKNISDKELTIQNYDNEITNKAELNVQSNDNYITKDLQKNFTFDKKIRINNCFVNVKKDFLNQAKEKIKNVIKNNENDTFLISMLVDSEVVAASDEIYLMTSSLESIVNLININHFMIEKKLDNIKIICLTEEEWNIEKNNYIQNIKNGINYIMLEELEESINEQDGNTENKKISSSMEDIAEQLFSANKIEIE